MPCPFCVCGIFAAGGFGAKKQGNRMEIRAWQRMLSGRRLDLLNPSPLDIEIEDIAHGLAFVARWNGQTVGEFPYSVAEHSLLVEKLYTRLYPTSEPKWQLAALLHDAPEYVIGDMISPVKASVGPGYKELDDRLTAAVHMRFGLPGKLPEAIKKRIKRADKMSAWAEAIQIAGFTRAEADKLFGKPRTDVAAELALSPGPAPAVKAAFLERHHALLDQMGA